MNIKVGEKKVNSFSVGNPVADLGDAIVGTYEYDYVRDDGGSGGNTGGNSGDSDNGGCNCGGCCGDGDSVGDWIDRFLKGLDIATRFLKP